MVGQQERSSRTWASMSDDAGFQLRIAAGAEDDLSHLDKSVAQRIARKLIWLSHNARQYPHNALTGDLAGLFRYRVGDYRVIYELRPADELLIVVRVGHRRDIYEK